MKTCLIFTSHSRKKFAVGDFGKTPKSWMYYMDRIWLVLRFLRATKLNHLDLHVACLYKLCSLFFSYDHPNYARYTTIYYLILLNLDRTHPGLKDLLKRNGFSVNRSGVPTSRNGVDITIQQTIIRHAKSHGGIIGFIRNYAAYYRWCMTRHSRAQYLQATMEMLNMDNTNSSSHKDIRKSEIQHTEADARRLLMLYQTLSIRLKLRTKTFFTVFHLELQHLLMLRKIFFQLT